MTDIAFHFGAPDKLAYACRLLRKAAASGAQVVVWAQPPLLQQLNEALWTFSPEDFVPHACLPADAVQARHSPVLLTASLDAPGLSQQVLVNLTEMVPDTFSHFDRVIEIVSEDPSDRDTARQRWRFYTQQGYSITRHDLKLKTS